MTQLITNGIKISVKTKYNGIIQQGENQLNAFSYYISIENETTDAVQLLGRFWEISDALNDKEYVEGEGVVGQKPIIEPREFYTYKSNCFLFAATGSMKGRFTMINLETKKKFKVTIPTFQLTSTASLN
jgi:ApaG protein